jgi:hypothetical protein
MPRQKPLEAGAVAGFVAGHFVDGVVNGVQALFFGAFGNVGLARARAVFRFDTQFQVLFGAGGNDFAQKFGKLGGVFGFLKGIALVGFRDFGVALPLGNAAHRQVHSHLAAFAVKVRLKVTDDIRVHAFGNSQHMLRSKTLSGFLLAEFGGRGLALGARRGRLIARMHVTAH